MLAGRHWPGVFRSAASGRVLLGLILLIGSAVLASGCGHASVPCTTPPAILDEHRAQSEAAQRDLDQKTGELSALESRREEVARRIEAAKAVEDSLKQASAH